MTKTLRKALIASLMFVLAILIGFAVRPVLAKADDADAHEDSTAVTRFLNNVEALRNYEESLTSSEYDTLFTEIEDVTLRGQLWNAYLTATNAYTTNALTAAEKEHIRTQHADSYALYNAAQGKFGDAYSVYTRITSLIYNIAQNRVVDNGVVRGALYSKDMDTLESVMDAYTQLTENEKTFLNGVRSGTNVEVYQGESAHEGFTSQWASENTLPLDILDAEFRLWNIKKNIDAAEEAIVNGVLFFNADQHEMTVYTGNESNTLYIVLDSADTLAEVKQYLDEVNELDYSEIEHYELYLEALTALDEQNSKWLHVVDLIDAVYGRIEGAAPSYTKYYTLKEEVEAARKAYADLLSEDGLESYSALARINVATCQNDHAGENHNDLQSKVNNLNLLTEMEEYIKSVDAKIEALNGKIAAIDVKYTYDCLQAIKEAEALFAELDSDITSNDIALYEDGEEEGYWVSEYPTLRAARATWDALNDEVKELVDKVLEMIAMYERGEAVDEILNEIYAIYGYDPNGTQLTPEQRAAFGWGTASTNPAWVDEDGNSYWLVSFDIDEDGDTEDDLAIDDVLQAIQAKVDYLQGITGDLNNAIYRLWAQTTGAGQCVFPRRERLNELHDLFEALKEENPDAVPYVSYADLLEDMWAEYLEELAAIEAWQDAVAQLPDVVTVGNWNLVDDAEDAFGLRDVDHVVDLQLLLSTDGEYAEDYAAYEAAIDARDTLKELIEKAAELMGAIDCDDNLDLDKVEEFVKAYDDATDAYDALEYDAEDPDTAQFEGAQDYLQENYPDEWANYELAAKYIPRYRLEQAIKELYDAIYNEEDDTLGENVTLHDAHGKGYGEDAYYDDNEHQGILEVWALYLAFIDEETGYGTDDDIRGLNGLKEMKAALDAITAALDAWARDVLGLIVDDVDATLDYVATTNAMAAALAEFEGYPLDLDAWKALGEAYDELVENLPDTDDRTGYLTDAKAFYDALWTKSDKLLDDIVEDLKDIQKKQQSGDLTAEDLEDLRDILDLIEDLHPTQQDELEKKLGDAGIDLDDITDAIDELVAVESFKDMIDALYQDVVVNNNVTSLTQYYIDVIRAIYDSFSTSVKATLKDAEEGELSYMDKLDEIQAYYDAAVEAGTVLELEEVKKDLEAKDAELEAKYNELKDALDAQYAELLEKLGDQDAELKAALEAKYNELKADLDAKYNELKDELASLNGALDDLDEALEDAVAGIEAELAELDQAMTDLANKMTDSLKQLAEYFDGQLAKVKEALESQIEDLGKALTDMVNKALEARQTGDEKLAAELEAKAAELQAALEAAKNALENGDANLQAQLDALKEANAAAQSSLEDALNAIRAKIEEIKAAQQKQLDALQARTTALIAIVIVLAVILVAAMVCIVLLFIKRNKA